MATADVTAAIISLFVGILAIVWAAVLGKRVLNKPKGNGKMVEISEFIARGARTFLLREYKALSVFVVIVTIVIGVITMKWQTPLCFFAGACISAGTGWIGMNMAVRANVRTCEAARNSLNDGLRVAFDSGSVMANAVVGCGIVGLSFFYLILGNFEYLAGFGMGASSIALFARVGGGIFTKAADVGSDLVGKVEAGIPEDDPRNPGVIADNVGDNVGDVAGMGADLFESYVGSIIACASLAPQVPGGNVNVLIALPMYIAALGIICSILGSFFVRTKSSADDKDIQSKLLNSMRLGIFMSAAFVIVTTALLVWALGLKYTYCLDVYTGLVAGVLIGMFTEYATSFAYTPTISIAKAGYTGPATVIIQGLGVGQLSTLPPVLIICVSILICVALDGVYGVSLAAVGMLSTLGVTLATDAYGPVADNAGGIAEMAELDHSVRVKTDALDALGNTTAATGKGFAIGSAVLTALALLTAYTKAVGVTSVDLVGNTVVIPGVILGAMLPYLFSALTMLAVGKAAGSIIQEVRRQFKEVPGLLEGREGAKADYEACVDISTKAALREMVLPGALAVLVPVVIGIGFGPHALAGVLVGSISCGFLLAVMMANAGGAWDNAKKYVESGALKGIAKGSTVHAATVTGDTVGDPFKDTAGPSLNILIKLMTIVALVLAPAFTESFSKANWWVGVIIAVIGLFFSVGFWVWLQRINKTVDFSAEILAKANTTTISEPAKHRSRGGDDEAMDTHLV